MAYRDPRQHHLFDSTRVAEGWYDPDLMQLELEFVDGTHWFYDVVTFDEWDLLRRSGSPGRFVNDVLNQHANRKV